MKAIPLTVAALIVGAALFTPAAAYADDFPADHSDFYQVGTPEIDCDTGVWSVPTVHWAWVEIPEGSEGHWWTVGETTEVVSDVTGGAIPGDCPWWTLGDDDVWYDARTDPAAVPDVDDAEEWLDSGWTGTPAANDEGTPESDQVEPEKAGLAVVWKLGI